LNVEEVRSFGEKLAIPSLIKAGIRRR